MYDIHFDYYLARSTVFLTNLDEIFFLCFVKEI